jgi:predicted nucleotidyltransferase
VVACAILTNAGIFVKNKKAMRTEEDAIKYATDFLLACRSLPIKIDRAVLFGSSLSGKIHESSDIDLALFSGSFTDNILLNLDQIAMVNIRFPELDVHTYPTTSYNGSGMLLDEIKKNGMEMAV